MSFTIAGTFKLPDAGAAPMLNWRKLLPHPVKLAYRMAKRQLRDLQSGTLFKIAKSSRSHTVMPFSIELSQSVIPNAWLQNKLHNFRQAARQVNAVTLQPGQVFSFWKTVGNPTANKGYKKGRNLVNGQVSETYGGGLCQLSGILYHTSLLAGLAIVERHNHSVDLYANGETRFTPLGADATVAFGYKDLRVANPFSFAVRFELEVVGETLVCRLRSEEVITEEVIEFQASSKNGSVEVLTMKVLDVGKHELICKSGYRLPV
jgi:vancomycin resistance protein VanW